MKLSAPGLAVSWGAWSPVETSGYLLWDFPQPLAGGCSAFTQTTSSVYCGVSEAGGGNYLLCCVQSAARRTLVVRWHEQWLGVGSFARHALLLAVFSLWGYQLFSFCKHHIPPEILWTMLVTWLGCVGLVMVKQLSRKISWDTCREKDSCHSELLALVHTVYIVLPWLLKPRTSKT